MHIVLFVKKEYTSLKDTWPYCVSKCVESTHSSYTRSFSLQIIFLQCVYLKCAKTYLDAFLNKDFVHFYLNPSYSK